MLWGKGVEGEYQVVHGPMRLVVIPDEGKVDAWCGHAKCDATLYLSCSAKDVPLQG